MLHDLGGFWPVRPGSDGMLYHALYGKMTLGKLTGYLTYEIAICLRTEGFNLMNWSVLMGWGEQAHPLLHQIQDLYVDDARVEAEARSNSLSVTREDGLDWLRVILRRRPTYFGPVPVWTKRALREVRFEAGCKSRDLPGLVGVPIVRSRWVGDKR